VGKLVPETNISSSEVKAILPDHVAEIEKKVQNVIEQHKSEQTKSPQTSSSKGHTNMKNIKAAIESKLQGGS